MATALHNLSDYDPAAVPSAKGMKFGIVVSEWNHNITGTLLQGAHDTLLKQGVKEEDILIKTVPGSFELIFACVNRGLCVFKRKFGSLFFICVKS